MMEDDSMEIGSDAGSSLTESRKTGTKSKQASKRKRTCTVNDFWFKEPAFVSFRKIDSENVLCMTCNIKLTITGELLASAKHILIFKNFAILCVILAGKGKQCMIDHKSSARHGKSLRAVSNHSNVLETYVVSSSEMNKVRAAEGTIAYHLVKRKQSFNSVNDLMDLLPVVFNDSSIAKKITCKRTKAEAIIINVLAPHSISCIQKEIENVNFISIATDGSNHNEIKMFPVLVQYFIPELGGIQTKLIDMTKLSNEKAVTVCEWLMNVRIKTSCFGKTYNIF